MKKLYATLFIFLVVVVSIFVYLKNRGQTPINPEPQAQASFDGKNATFTINSQPITLINGQAEMPSAPNSASKDITAYFGNEAKGDLNGDGFDDVAFLVTQSTGGTGQFYYAVAALKTAAGYETTNAFLIGDRIAPQSTEIKSGELHVNFAERKEGEPMSTAPTQGAVLLLKVTPDGILERVMK